MRLKIGNKITKLIVIVFIVILISVSYILIKHFLEYKENENLNDDLFEDSIMVDDETNEFIIDWDYLKSINEDIIGWIVIEDTNINYPILQDDGSLYYLKHNYKKEYSSSGSIFTINTYPFTGEETVIYGHNMKNKSMFSCLGNYLKKDFLNSHNIIKIYTPTINYEGVIFSAYSIGINTETNNIKSLDFNSKLKYYKNASQNHIDFSSEITKIVKLSTCSYINAKTSPTDQRYYIIASIFPID